MQARPPEIVLASGSAIRRQLLAGAGIAFRVVPAEIDEAAVKMTLLGRRPPARPAEVAAELASAKAREVSRREPGALVIGADQVLEHDGEILSKAKDAAGARTTLSRLRGRPHHLHSAVAVVLGGAVVWSLTPSARLLMRPFSDGALADYLQRAGDALTSSVGAYQLEGLGVQLFEEIEGDYFTILGLPLLPLLRCLRAQGALPS